MKTAWLFSGLALGLLTVSPLAAHPVPRSQHDRTIDVHLQPGPNNQVLVRVNYRLEVDEVTVALDDMFPFRDEVDYGLLRTKPLAFYAAFAQTYAPILGKNMTATGNGHELSWTCVEHRQRLHDEKEQPLGHLRCDFVFQASFPINTDRKNSFSLREGNYELQPGLMVLSLTADPRWQWTQTIGADEALKKRPLTEWQPGDEEKLRTVAGEFGPTQEALPASPGQEIPPSSLDAPRRAAEPSLFQLLLRSEHGFWLLLLFAAGLGAVHALTPGHGKTLVAAYLVGQHGTIVHAIALGLVTTLTHTGAVLLLAGGLHFLSEDALRNVQTGLGLFMGLIVACFGFYLLLQRLSGRADHIHIGGGHHHHHDHHHPHHAMAGSANKKVDWWGLVVLGMSGGIVPCWDAILMLFLAVGMNLLWLALPLLLAFSAGLAGVLVLIGILVVQLRRFADSRWGEGRLIRSLPIGSALLVMLLGIWLCYESVHHQ